MSKQMPYNRLGSAGLQVSQFSFGSWVTFGGQVDTGLAKEQLQAAADAGVNFFDNAEVYAGGKSEQIMGEAIRELGWKRHEYVISTKFYWGINGEMPNMHYTLNRKYLMQAIDGSLERLGLDFVDLAYCHRPDPNTPIEETVYAMSDIVESGKALYWGTSEWSADEIRAAWEIADKRNLRKPVMEQPQYNLLHRDRVENEYARLYEDLGLGLTTWSPLAGGILTGKYVDGIPEGSRATLEGHDYLRAGAEKSRDQVRELAKIAADLGVSTGQLALGWVAANPHVSTVILGASSVKQLEENLGALKALESLNDDAGLKASIDELF
ncbi:MULTISPECIES: potassium channel beta subunit family protein [Trueperella]|uniref:Aldo/keto reductase n=1 Tax=Trueperella bernardiae TaxID=59561 RepID=A0AAW6ZM24_9ACTO|nr:MULTISPECIES: aldo/keto reductase [Trueperella]MCM3908041.1 aldo/keto reductase [Trueperella bernardiae]MDK8602002.1 aldo/keto reductase [Trueperella bernardiae]WIM07962.1 aldo/keto reductase [Trueperella bernardiae]